jgi:hypothetical protein
LAGVWNSIEAEDSPRVTYDLVDLEGRPSGVRLHQIGGTEIRSASDPSVSGDDAALMNDALITYTASLESCLFVNGLEPGTYEVITYAWMPNAPEGRARVRHDPSPTVVDVGGAWTGAHVEGITYARHVLEIASDGFLGAHSGIVPGELESDGAALNGIQLRRLVTGPPEVDAGTDAGDPPGADAARVDAGAGGGGGRDGGGCSVTGQASSCTAWLAIAGLIAWRFRRRR